MTYDHTAKERNAALRERRKAAGFKRVEVWVPAKLVPDVRQLVADLIEGYRDEN